MSTKVYDGYRIDGFNDFESFQRFVDSAVSALKAEVRPLIARFLAQQACNRIDDLRPSDDPTDTVLSCVAGELEEAHREILKTGHRNPRFDFNVELGFAFLPQGLFARMICEQSELVKFWESLPGVNEFGFSNAGDKPKRLSDEEWELRETVWSEWDKHSKIGITIFDRYSLPYIPPEEVVAAMPSLEERAARIAKNQIVTERADHLALSKPAEERMHLVMDALDWASREDEGKAAVAARLLELIPTLEPTPTVARLMAPLNGPKSVGSAALE